MWTAACHVPRCVHNTPILDYDDTLMDEAEVRWLQMSSCLKRSRILCKTPVAPEATAGTTDSARRRCSAQPKAEEEELRGN